MARIRRELLSGIERPPFLKGILGVGEGKADYAVLGERGRIELGKCNWISMLEIMLEGKVTI